jgi:hypothetical protein
MLSWFLGVSFCVFNDVVMSYALVFEPAEDDIMLRPPRKRGKDRIFTWSMLFYAYGYMGVCMSLAVWITVREYLASNGLTWSQWFYSWTSLNYTNGDDPANQRPGVSLSPTEVHKLLNETGSSECALVLFAPRA